MKNLNEKFNNAFLISDGDLDGAGAIVVAKKLFPNITFASIKSRNEVDAILSETILSKKYSTILMADCSPSTPEAINLINKFVEEGNDFVLLDHHKSALELNKYSWSRVKVETDGFKHSGTELIYNYFKELGIDVSNLSEFAELVRCYDTWDWFDKGIDTAEKLNRLYWFLGIDDFLGNITKKIASKEPIFNMEDEIILKVIEKLDKEYISERKTMFETINYKGLNVAVLFTDRCVSQLGNIICRENDDIDFSCLIDLNRNKCSMRSLEGKTDVSLIAKEYGGGGHAQASGFMLNSKAKEELLKNIF